MRVDTTAIRLKDGRQALLRAPSPDEAEAMLRAYVQIAEECAYVANYPEEIRYTVETERDYLDDSLSAPNSAMIVAEVDGELAGNCQIVFKRTQKTRHRASVMIGLKRAYQRLGIGSAMFRAMEQIARARGARQLELDCIEGNEPALGLYHKMGFEEVGRLPDAYRFKDGSRHAEIRMRKALA